jgi:hypothetical protein
MDSKGLVGLPNNHGWYGYGGRFLAFTPLLVYEVQVAMHPGHLVRGEVVSALIICEDKKKKKDVEAVTCTSAQMQDRSHCALAIPSTLHLTFNRLRNHQTL